MLFGEKAAFSFWKVRRNSLSGRSLLSATPATPDEVNPGAAVESKEEESYNFEKAEEISGKLLELFPKFVKRYLGDISLLSLILDTNNELKHFVETNYKDHLALIPRKEQNYALLLCLYNLCNGLSPTTFQKLYSGDCIRLIDAKSVDETQKRVIDSQFRKFADAALGKEGAPIFANFISFWHFLEKGDMASVDDIWKKLPQALTHGSQTPKSPTTGDPECR